MKFIIYVSHLKSVQKKERCKTTADLTVQMYTATSRVFLSGSNVDLVVCQYLRLFLFKSHLKYVVEIVYEYWHLSVNVSC